MPALRGFTWAVPASPKSPARRSSGPAATRFHALAASHRKVRAPTIGAATSTSFRSLKAWRFTTAPPSRSRRRRLCIRDGAAATGGDVVSRRADQLGHQRRHRPPLARIAGFKPHPFHPERLEVDVLARGGHHATLCVETVDPPSPVHAHAGVAVEAHRPLGSHHPVRPPAGIADRARAEGFVVDVAGHRRTVLRGSLTGRVDYPLTTARGSVAPLHPAGHAHDPR